MPLLLVEDNPITRKMIRVALAKDGHRVLEAPDGRTALAHMASGAPDLVLQDLLLPDIDGLELLERFRSAKEGQDIPILGLTGLVSKPEGSRTLSAAFDEILLKPVELPRLTEAVRKRLRREPTSSLGRRGRGHRVIVADDDPVQRKLAVLWLEGAGFVVEPTVDDEEALDRARAYKDLCLGGTMPFGAATATGREWLVLARTPSSRRSSPAPRRCSKRAGGRCCGCRTEDGGGSGHDPGHPATEPAGPVVA